MADKEKVKTTELTTTPGNTPAPTLDLSALGDLADFKAGRGEEIDGLENVDQTDLKLPKYKLLQLTSKEVADGKGKAGQFYNTVTGQAYDELPCVLLVLGKSRVMWKQPFKRGEEPLCRSFDGKVKFDGKMSCANCDHQSWDKAQAAGKPKPDCNMSYVWLGLSVIDKSPFRLIASGASVANTKNFINVITPKKYPPYCYNMMLKSHMEKNDSGSFYVIDYDMVSIPTVEDVKERKDLAEGMRDAFMKAIELDTSKATDEDVTSNSAAGGEDGQLF